MPAATLVVQQLLIFQVAEQLSDVAIAETLTVIKRQLESGATHVIQKYQQLLRIDARVLR